MDLNEFQYKHIKKYKTIKGKKCSICLSKYIGTDIIKEFPCKHIYHKNCLLKWLKKSNLCPLCKYNIKNDVINTELSKSSGSENDEEEEEKKI